jgi:mannitol/fructose-specific phosphotransferase system IIA component
MNEYVVLEKLSPSKILDAIQNLRKIPENGIEGIDNYHTMNIFGTWNVGVWFNAKNTKTALDFVHNNLKKVSGVVDSYVLSMFPQSDGTINYMVLLKLSPKKLLDAIQNLRKIPENGIEGINSYYTMNIFGTWDVAVWFNAKNTKTALDFVNNKLKKVSGVVDSFVLSMFQQYQTIDTSTSTPEKTPKKPEKVIIEAKH